MTRNGIALMRHGSVMADSDLVDFLNGPTDSAINFNGSADLHTPIHPPPNSWSFCGRMLAVSWSDNKRVCFFSTIHKPVYAPDTPQANKEVRRRSKQEVVQVPCPTVFKDYNKYMCGIDRADQNNRYYSAGRNCKHWPPRMVFH